MRRAWDACAYNRVSAAMDPLAEPVLDRLDLRGDETVLDAGCGTGRITSRLLEKVPNGRVMAVDVDAEMVELARKALPAGTVVMQSDLLELRLPEPVDVVFSTATFHWVLDHDRLFARLASVLRPGGRLVAQCGGAGNVRRLLEAAEAVAAQPQWAGAFDAFQPNWYFATPEETQQRLRRHGFVDIRCWLQRFAVTPDEPLAYLETIPLGSWVQLLPQDQRRTFTQQVADRLGEPLTIDYVRLNIDARRAVADRTGTGSSPTPRAAPP
jgi:trans-aconitate 2-methyltransferase